MAKLGSSLWLLLVLASACDPVGILQSSNPREGQRVALGNQDCTTCICAWGPCYYDHDCPDGVKCDLATNACTRTDGSQVPTVFKDQCDTFLHNQIDCDKKAIKPLDWDKKPDPMGCKNVRMVVKGHGSPEDCNPFMAQGKCCVLDGAEQVFMCHEGCSVMQDTAGAQKLAEEMCKEFSKTLGEKKYKVTWKGSQTISMDGCETYFYLKCENGELSTKYEPCSTLLGMPACAQPDDKVQCSKDDGWSATAICCPGIPSPRWILGTSCPVKPCDELRGGLCFGLDAEGNDTTPCKDSSSTRTLHCCNGKLAPVQFAEDGQWMNQCVSSCSRSQAGSCGHDGLYCPADGKTCELCPDVTLNCDGKGDCECDVSCTGNTCGPTAAGSSGSGSSGSGSSGSGSSGSGSSSASSSCQGSCGEQAPGGCYCDSMCDSSGDCCSDFAQVCGGSSGSGSGSSGSGSSGSSSTKGSCEGFCGDESSDGCFCDSYCAYSGDCCADYMQVCGE